METETKIDEVTIKAEQIEKENWLADELEVTKQNSTFDGEKKPALKLEENKITNMTIDFSKPFDKWEDHENQTVKKIIPVHVGAVDLVWWLNVKNPIYSQIIEKGSKGQTDFKVLQTGDKKTTKYALVE